MSVEKQTRKKNNSRFNLKIIAGSVLLISILSLLFLFNNQYFIKESDEQGLSIYMRFDIKDNKNSSPLKKGKYVQVVLVNNSDKPKLIWKDNCSLGYDSLTFELTDTQENKHVIKKKEKLAWTIDYPNYHVIQPKQTFAMDVFYNSNIWKNFSNFSTLKANQNNTFKIRATFQNKVKANDLHGLWTKKIDKTTLWIGTLKSIDYDCTFSYKDDELEIIENGKLVLTDK